MRTNWNAKLAVMALAVATTLAAPLPARAQEALVTFKSLNPDLALDLARAALADCRRRGYQVAVAVVDRFGVTQVVLRDRFAGPHTVATAIGKAWTAVSFRTDTLVLAGITAAGQIQSGVRELPGVVAIGGGNMIMGGGAIVGGIGVSGGPDGPADEECVKAGLESIASQIDF